MSDVLKICWDLAENCAVFSFQSSQNLLNCCFCFFAGQRAILCAQGQIECNGLLAFRNALALLGRDARVLIVTSDYHVRRALRPARRVGLRARGVGAPLPHDELWRCNRILEIRWSIELRRGWLDYPGARPEEGRLRMEARFGKYKERRDELLAQQEASSRH